MRKTTLMKSLLACLALVGLSLAGEKGAEVSAAAKEKAAAAVANRKAYDALYSDIIRTLPQEGLQKVDSARGSDGKAEAGKSAGHAKAAKDAKKKASEKRNKELDQLPSDVKDRVDKAMSHLEKRKKEKKSEFKELK
jgi:hypothetical protein